MAVHLVTLLLLGCGAPAELAPASAPIGARVLDPGCAGSPWASIQDAIDDAVDGDIVRVCDGTWLERLTISGKTLTLESVNGAQSTTVDAEGLGTTLTVIGGADVTVRGLTLTRGATAGTGGNVSCESSTLTLTDSTLRSGSATDGGGIGALDCAGLVSNTTFEDNAAVSGGGASVLGDGPAIEGSTFTENVADFAGGGLYLGGDAPITGNVFLRNDSAHKGGGAYVEGGWGDIVANTFVSNTCVDDGGGIYLHEGAPWFEGNTMVSNEAGDEGGGLRVKVSEAMILDNTMISNHATVRGGGSKISHDEVVLIGNAFLGNSSWYGGGLLMVESASPVVDNVFRRNTATSRGGGLAVWLGWGDVELEDCVFEDNESLFGGHVHIDLVGHTTSFVRVDFRDGVANHGGAIYAEDSDVWLENVLLEGNEAAISGGALHLLGTTGEVRNALLVANDAPDGAGVLVESGLGLEIVNTGFERNTGGAAVHVDSGVAPGVRFSHFDRNTLESVGLGPLVGVDGNIDGLPGFVAPRRGDYALTATSRLTDAGDPAILDVDGTLSDIGLYGGPAGGQ